MKYKLVYFLFIAYFSFPTLTWCQNYIADITHISIEDGLSSRFVFDVIQDKEGFMWIATSNGLNRYDGKDFKFYALKDIDPDFTFIHGLHEDQQGMIWMVNEHEQSTEAFTARYVYILNPKTDEIFSFDKLLSEIAPFKMKDILAVYADSEKRIWMVTRDNKLYRYDGQFKQIYSNLKYPNIQNGLVFQEDKVFISNEHSILVIDTLGNFIKEKIIDDPTQKYVYWMRHNNNPGKILFSKFTRENNHFLSLNDRYYSYDINKDTVHSSNLSSNTEIFPFAFDHNNHIWINENLKLKTYNKDRKLIYDFSPLLQRKTPKNNIAVERFFFDKNNVAWISTNDGLFKINLRQNQFDQYLLLKNDCSIRGIESINDSMLLVASYQGFFEINVNTGEAFSLLDQVGVKIIKGPDDNLWIGSYYPFIQKYDPKTKAFTEFHNVDPTSDNVRSIPFFSKRNNLWIGSKKGLAYLDPTDQKIKPFKQYNEFTALANAEIYHFEETSEGIWIANRTGLYLLDENAGIIKQEFENENILHFHIDEDDTFWLATHTSGLIEWNRKEKKQRSYGIKDGFSNDELHSVLPDDFGNLWISSNNGLMRFNKKNHTVTVFTEREGLNHVEQNRISYFKHPNGSLFYGGLNGVFAFDPADFQQSKIHHHSPLQITAFSFLDHDGQIIDKTKSIIANQHIELSHHIKSFTLNFALLDFTNPRLIQYAYQIEGFDKGWTMLKENFVRVNQLPAGEYTLRVKGAGADGFWSNDMIELPLIVNSAFYQTWWFSFFFAMGLLSLITIYWRWRLQQADRVRDRLEKEVQRRTAEIDSKKKELSTLNKTKDRLFEIIAHDLRGPAFTLNQLSSKVNYLIEQQQYGRLKKYGKSVDNATSGMYRLLENLLQWSQQQSGKIKYKPRTIFFEEMQVEIVQSFQIAAKLKGIEIKFQYEPQLHFFADQHAIAIVLRNLVDNAIKFTPDGGIILIEAKMNTTDVTITLTDNGIGIPSEMLPYIFDVGNDKSTVGTQGEKGTGLGLMLCKELIESNKGHISVNSLVDQGTTFTLTLPMTAQKSTILN